MSKWERFLWGLPGLAMAALPESVQACAVCFGQPDSKLAQGMNMGVLALLIVIVAVLGGFAAFFIFLARRAARGASVVAGASSSPSK